MRGEVYWVESDTLSIERKIGRPAVIVSSDKGNVSCPQIIGLFMTTKQKFGIINVPVGVNGRPSWVQCNYVITIDKARLGNYMCTLTEDEMVEINRGMKVALGLTQQTDDEDFVSEDFVSNESISAEQEEKIAELTHTGKVWQKLYEKALEEIASLRFEADRAKRVAVEPKVEEPVIAEPKVEEPVEEESPLVDLNTCSESDLRKCGCDPTLIRNIIARRPYKTVYDLRFVPGLKSVGYAILKAKVCVGEPKQEERVPKVKPANVETPKVNINTATARELMDGVGLSTFYAYRITAHRNQNGKYESLESLLEAKKIPKDFLERYGDKLTV
mgnify:FL=1